MPDTPATNHPIPPRQTARTRASDALLEPLQAHIRQLDAFLLAQVNEFEPAVRHLVTYTLTHHGKRLRPALVFYAGWTDNSPPQPELVRAAAIVELVHLATLIHDDILDNAGLRHNTPTLATRHGPHTAVLLGDALFAHALTLAASYPTTDICHHVATTTRQVCSGEIHQNAESGNTRLTLGQYYRIIRLKTAELFELSCRLGAHLATNDPAYTDACARHGRHLGTAYQILDDITDFAGNETGTGKTLGTDLANGKYTLPVLLHLGQLPASDATALGNALAQGTMTPAQLAQRLSTAGIPAQCQRIFHEEITHAQNALAPYAATPAAAHLHSLTLYLHEQLHRLDFA
ncbi:MAG: polyprenyl synthetase family protein [Puniceicoccales bacterium]|jgi:octaprenyl-diphosphate synthase|nr:polyprenyl synthetase family protein [Puniceicoccales bacterium]